MAVIRTRSDSGMRWRVMPSLTWPAVTLPRSFDGLFGDGVGAKDHDLVLDEALAARRPEPGESRRIEVAWYWALPPDPRR